MSYAMQVIAEHFFHEGQFEVGQTFVEEARIPDGNSLQEPYREMHQVLKEVRRHPSACWRCSDVASSDTCHALPYVKLGIHLHVPAECLCQATPTWRQTLWKIHKHGYGAGMSLLSMPSYCLLSTRQLFV